MNSHHGGAENCLGHGRVIMTTLFRTEHFDDSSWSLNSCERMVSPQCETRLLMTAAPVKTAANGLPCSLPRPLPKNQRPAAFECESVGRVRAGVPCSARVEGKIVRDARRFRRRALFAGVPRPNRGQAVDAGHRPPKHPGGGLFSRAHASRVAAEENPRLAGRTAGGPAASPNSPPALSESTALCVMYVFH